MFRYIRKKFRRLMNLFRSRPPFNIDHPDLQDKVEVAFVTGGTTYYRFKHDYDMPVGRYKYVQACLHEVDMRLTLERLNEFINKLEEQSSGKKGKVDMNEIVKTIIKLKSFTKLAFNVETVERLAAVVYFTDSELLNSYDKATGEKKIQTWRDFESMDFFITRPINELLKLKNISIDSLEAYVKWQRDVFNDLTSDTLIQSEENS